MINMKGDIDRYEAEVNINFHTLINLEIELFKHYCFITFLFVKRLVDTFIVKTEKVCHSALYFAKKVDNHLQSH